MNERDSSSPAVGMDRSSGEDALTAGMDKEAEVMLQSQRFAECVEVLNQILQKNGGDPKEHAIFAREREETPRQKEKARAIALQAEESDSLSTSGSEEDDLAMLSRSFGAFLRRKKFRYDKSKIHKPRTHKFFAGDREGAIMCYNYKKYGHVMDCPELVEEKSKKHKRKRKKDKKDKGNKKKALWVHSDSELSASSSSKEEANFCL